MVSLLGRIQGQNDTWFVKLPPKNTRFRGTIFPVNPTALPTSVFVLPRIALRVRPGTPVKPRDLFKDPFGRIMLVADHDMTLSGDAMVSHVYALIQMTQNVSWKRTMATPHPVTGLPTASAGPVEMGPIWVSIENYTRGDNDAGVRVTTDRQRCITGSSIRLGDMINGQTVKRLSRALGVSVAEIE